MSGIARITLDHIPSGLPPHEVHSNFRRSVEALFTRRLEEVWQFVSVDDLDLATLASRLDVVVNRADIGGPELGLVTAEVEPLAEHDWAWNSIVHETIRALDLDGAPFLLRETANQVPYESRVVARYDWRPTTNLADIQP